MLYLALVFTAILLGVVVKRIIAYRRYLHQPTRTAVSKEFKRDLEKEDALRTRAAGKFKESLERARRRV